MTDKPDNTDSLSDEVDDETNTATADSAKNDDQRIMRKPVNKTTATQEFGGPVGLEPTRYGDWEKNGRAIDF